jgi:hypothetical protein
MAEILSAKQCILCAAENRYNRKFTRFYGEGMAPSPPLGSAPEQYSVNKTYFTIVICFFFKMSLNKKQKLILN